MKKTTGPAERPTMADSINGRRFLHREPTTQLSKIIEAFRIGLHRLHPELPHSRLDNLSKRIISHAVAEMQKEKGPPTDKQLTKALREQLNEALKRERKKKARIVGAHALQNAHRRRVIAHSPKPSTAGMLPRYSRHIRH